MSKASRRIRLTPLRLPEIRDGLAKRERERLEAIGDWGTPYRKMMDDAWSSADSLSVAPLWWVSSDMTALSVAAAADGVPDSVVPSTMTGFVVFESALPPDATPSIDVPVRAIQWTASEVERGDQHGLRIGVVYYTSDRAYLKERGESRLPLASVIVNDSRRSDIRAADVLRAVWALSSEPRICDVQRAAPPPVRHGGPPPMARMVKILVLRENRRSPFVGDDDGGGMEYSHRFIVRGFWRNQPCGPHNSERRLQWIPPYVKGPADKPLVVKETVRVWRR